MRVWGGFRNERRRWTFAPEQFDGSIEVESPPGVERVQVKPWSRGPRVCTPQTGPRVRSPTDPAAAPPSVLVVAPPSCASCHGRPRPAFCHRVSSVYACARPQSTERAPGRRRPPPRRLRPACTAHRAEAWANVDSEPRRSPRGSGGGRRTTARSWCTRSARGSDAGTRSPPPPRSSRSSRRGAGTPAGERSRASSEWPPPPRETRTPRGSWRGGVAAGTARRQAAASSRWTTPRRRCVLRTAGR